VFEALSVFISTSITLEGASDSQPVHQQVLLLRTVVLVRSYLARVNASRGPGVPVCVSQVFITVTNIPEGSN
jgi:hypothetical protein